MSFCRAESNFLLTYQRRKLVVALIQKVESVPTGILVFQACALQSMDSDYVSVYNDKKRSYHVLQRTTDIEFYFDY